MFLLMKEDKNKRYEVILKEEEALTKALNMAKRGDTIIVFFEDMNPLVKIIESFSGAESEESGYGYEALS